MPLYEFYCSKCDMKQEELCNSSLQSINCPSCGEKANRLISAFRTGRSSTGGGTDSSACGG